MKKITNKRAREYVEKRLPFKGSHLWGEYSWKTAYNLYIVYSYSYKWPLLMYYRGKWYANTDKYSVSTSRHLTQARPWGVKIKEMTRSELIVRIQKYEINNHYTDVANTTDVPRTVCYVGTLPIHA
jgi:hypothetical protein